MNRILLIDQKNILFSNSNSGKIKEAINLKSIKRDDLKVIKRDGRIQDFNINKIKLSIQRASDDMNMPMTESDSKSIVKNIYEKIQDHKKVLKKNESSIGCGEIHEKVLETLNEFGFNGLASFYNQASKLC